MSGRESDWRFTEQLVADDEVLQQARTASLELGVDAVSAAVGAQLSVMTALAGATAIIEVGTGAGVSGLHLLRGAPDAVLTSIDVEADHQAAARAAFTAEGIAANRLRLITGRARQVLPRMNEAAYDVVFIDADPGSVIEYVEHGLRMVRPGGAVLVARALWRGRVADPTARDDTTAAFRALLTTVSESDEVQVALSPAGDGLLQLVRRR